MADVSRSISLSKKLSNADDLSSKHIYDGVFSAPTATKRNASTFSIRIDDYCEIFSPSDASLGSSIPILDLPAVDRSDVIGRGRSSGVDYAGVFGGIGDDDRVGVPAEVLFRESKKKAKTDSHPSRSSMATKIPVSKSQEFSRDSGNSQASKSPTKTRMTISKSQDFCFSTRDNPTSSQVSESTTKTGTVVSKGQEVCGSSRDNPISSQALKSPTKRRMMVSKSQEFCVTSGDIPTSSQSSKSPTKTRMTHSKSQEFCGSSRDNGTSSDVSTDQQFDSMKHLNIPYQKINQSSKDATAGMTQNAHLHAGPGYSRTFEEVSSARNIGLNKAKRMSMDEADFSMDVSKGKRRGKYTRAVSDIGTNKQTSDRDAHKEFGMGECHTFDASHSTREANRKPQSVSPILTSSQLFGSNDYFRRSSSQGSKSSTNNQQSDAAAGSTSPLLELDVNSTAAASAAAVKRALEEAEAKIRWAKEFLKGQECDGSTKLSFKNSLKVKATSSNYHSNEACGLKQNGALEVEARRQNKYVDEDKLLKQKGHLNTTVTSENINFNKAGGLKLKDDLNFSITKSQFADEAGMLNEKLNGVSAQEDTTMSFKSTCAAATFEEKHASLDPVECVNDAKFVEKANSPEAIKSTEKSYKDEGGGEWEAAKHISQLISGVKNRLVSFISKQADTEKIAVQDVPSSSGSVEQSEGSTCQVQDADAHIKTAADQDHVEKDRLVSFIFKQVDTENIAIQEDAPSSSGSVEQSEGSTCKVEDADAHKKRVADQDHAEKDVQMNYDASSWVGEIVQDSIIGMKIHKPGANEVNITVALEQGKVEDITASPDVEMLISQQCDLSEPDREWEVQESVEIKGELVQEDVQDQTEEDLDDCAMWEHEKDQVDTNECQEKDMAQGTTYKSGVYDSKKETIFIYNIETGKEVQDQEPVDKGVDVFFDAKDGTRRQEEGCSWRETEMPKASEKNLEDFQMVEEICTDELQERVQAAELFTWENNKTIAHEDAKSKSTVGVTEVGDDISEHDEKKLEDAQMVEEICTDELQETVQAAELFTWEDNKTIEHQDAKSKSTVGVTEVADDTSEHDEKKLEDAQMVEETCTDELLETVQAAELFTREDNKTVEHQDVKSKSTVGVNEVTDDTSEHDEKKLKDAQIVEETSTDELHERVQAVELFGREDDKTTEQRDDKSKSTVGVTEVADDTSEHDEKKSEDAQMVEEICIDELQERVQAVELFTREDNKTIEHQDVNSKSTLGVTEVAEETSEHDEFLILNRNKEACLNDRSSQYAQHFGSFSGGEERIEEPEISPFAPKMNTDQPLVVNKNEETCLHDESSQYAQHLRSSSGGEERIEVPATSPMDTKIKAEQPLVFSNDKEACLHNGSSNYAQHLESSSGGEEWMEEPATCPVEPEMNVEQPICSQTATQLVREDICEQKSYSFEVSDDVLEHDDYFPAKSHICEQEQSSMMRNEEACECDNTDQYAQDVESTNFEKGRMEKSKTKGNLQQPSSVCTVHDLIKKEMYEQTWSFDVADETVDRGEECPPPADETLDHEHECPPPADVCKNEVDSCLIEDNEGYEHDDRNEHSQDVEFSFEDEKMRESVSVTSSESEWNTEQPSSVQTVNKLIGEDMTETSISARDREDFVIAEKKVEDTREVLHPTNFQKIHCETDVDFEQKLANEEIFAADINSENQGDETEVRTDMGEVDKASDQDTRMHDAETSYKRKRWFQNRDEAGEFPRSGILLGAKITLDLVQENMQGSKVDDRVETNVDEGVNESGEGTNARQTGACSSVEDGFHSNEAIHRRRRWFENRGQEVLHKPSVFDGAGMTTQMDDQIAQESEFDDSLQTCVDELVNEGKKGTDAREEDVASDQVESRVTAEAAHRRRRWFESGVKLGPVQKPSILEDKGVTSNQEENTAKHDELGETSTASIMENKHQSQLNQREKEKERERKAVERVIREARQRAFDDARERAAVEARQKAAASAQDKQGKDSSEAKSGSDKASMDAKLREERAAVERATAEARERALQRALSEKAASKSKEKDSKNQTSGPSCSSGYSSATFATEKSSGVVNESPRRRKAISERHRRTTERAAKALEEKNMRDSLAQKEQAERNRFADALDADVKRWLTGKDGNLRAMLSTLQYILSPDSGWQPIPLTDLVTSTAVRKAYKRAALCVHPDKLQQRGATIQQKYICEKVFDLLKDAWHKLNPDDW